uniref:Uncharacterized protein n=1 Tax=Compsopogon caeruleus TaxID=31354 RepID=A0A7S1TG59_9RHOD
MRTREIAPDCDSDRTGSCRYPLNEIGVVEKPEVRGENTTRKNWPNSLNGLLCERRTTSESTLPQIGEQVPIFLHSLTFHPLSPEGKNVSRGWMWASFNPFPSLGLTSVLMERAYRRCRSSGTRNDRIFEQNLKDDTTQPYPRVWNQEN